MTENPLFWVAAGFVVFIGLVYKPLMAFATKALDARAEKIKAELNAAVRLREEAEAVLAAYQKKQRESVKEAEQILDSARAEAALMAETAEADLKKHIAARTKLAEEKIAQAERQAIADVRTHVVDMAVSAARSILVHRLETSATADSVTRAIDEIERKIH